MCEIFEGRYIILFKVKKVCYNVLKQIKRVHRKEKMIKEKFLYFWNTKLTKKAKRIMAISFASGFCLLAGAYILSQQLSYTGIKVVASYTSVGSANSRYEIFASGILRYGRDGAAYINYQGEEIWNQAYQISTPIIEVTGSCAVVADCGGNDIVVFDEDGIKGEITTTYPIEKISVSEQGIVAVLTKDVDTPRILCYDAVGNLLVEHKPSSSDTGYPTDVSISLDGNMLLVTYIQILDGELVSNYIYYNFDEGVSTSANQIVSQGQVSDSIIPEAYFINEDTSVLISDKGFMIYKGNATPELQYSVTITKEISMTFHSEKYIGFVLVGTGETENELRVYDLEGELVTSIGLNESYENADILGDEVILYEGTECKILTLSGVERFQGDANMEITGLFPTFGINKYILIGNEGIKKVQLTR